MVLGKLRILGAGDEPETSTRSPGDAPLTFPELLDVNRRTWGDRIAFQQKSRREWKRISHTEIYRRSYDIAAGLISLGVQPGDRVALVFENSIDWICAYYGIVVSGAIAVPIYYDLKPAEITEMLDRSEAKVLFTSPKVLERLSAEATANLHVLHLILADGGQRGAAVPPQLARGGAEALTIEELIAKATPESRLALADTVVEPDDLASIVFTSGTTGGMKGVTLTHRNFMANMRSICASIPFTERDRIVMVLPMHHAFPFVVTVVVAPAIGGTITFENDLRRIRDRMAEVKPTLFIGVPALFDVMYRNIVHGIDAQGRLESFERGLRIVEATKQRTGVNLGRIVFRELHKRLGGSLRFMVSGGAALNPQTALNFSRLGVCIIQGWGLTEASPVLSVQRWHPRRFYMSNYYEEHVGTVGAAIEGVEIGLIDVPEKELYVHLHGEGELVARGENITPGYWQADDATKAVRVGGWLRTGDVGYLDDEGNVWITGRSKFVIVLDSGEKVHPDEVEEKLDRSPAVQDVAIVGRKVRGKAQVWAVIYPNRDEVIARLGPDASAEAVRALMQDEIDANETDIAPYKRVVDFMLTDIPLPRTVPLRKIARGQIADAYEFDVARWERSWAELQSALSTPAQPEESEELVSA